MKPISTLLAVSSLALCVGSALALPTEQDRV